MATQLRPQLEKARDYLGTFVAMGGSESLPIISNMGDITRRLEELVAGISDDDLRGHVGSLQQSITEVLAVAPGHNQLMSTAPTRIQSQVDSARSGENQATEALKRLSILETRSAK